MLIEKQTLLLAFCIEARPDVIMIEYMGKMRIS
jgi:hypothetical protein